MLPSASVDDTAGGAYQCQWEHNNFRCWSRMSPNRCFSFPMHRVLQNAVYLPFSRLIFYLQATPLSIYRNIWRCVVFGRHSIVQCFILKDISNRMFVTSDRVPSKLLDCGWLWISLNQSKCLNSSVWKLTLNLSTGTCMSIKQCIWCYGDRGSG